MSRTRRTFGKDFKAKVVLEALKEKDTIEVLAKKVRAVAQSNFNVEVRSTESFCSFLQKKRSLPR
jgi:transposase-like protein